MFLHLVQGHRPLPKKKGKAKSPFFLYLCDKSEDVDLLLLTDTMGTILSLQIHLRVPITVVQDNNIGRDQVDTQTTSSCRQQEDKLVTVGFVVLVNTLDTVLMRSVSVDTAVLYKYLKKNNGTLVGE